MLVWTYVKVVPNVVHVRFVADGEVIAVCPLAPEAYNVE